LRSGFRQNHRHRLQHIHRKFHLEMLSYNETEHIIISSSQLLLNKINWTIVSSEDFFLYKYSTGIKLITIEREKDELHFGN
jgi:hypothetical protein